MSGMRFVRGSEKEWKRRKGRVEIRNRTTRLVGKFCQREKYSVVDTTEVRLGVINIIKS